MVIPSASACAIIHPSDILAAITKVLTMIPGGGYRADSKFGFPMETLNVNQEFLR
jgi:hypothetical protein